VTRETDGDVLAETNGETFGDTKWRPRLARGRSGIALEGRSNKCRYGSALSHARIDGCPPGGGFESAVDRP